MAEQASFVQDTRDRFEEARGRIDSEFRKVQKQLDARRKRIEKQTRKQVKQLQSDLRKNAVVKQVDEVRAQVTEQVDGILDRILGALQIASKSDVERINRKLNKINKRLKDMERPRSTNGSATPQI